MSAVEHDVRDDDEPELDWIEEVEDLLEDLRTLGDLPYDPTPGRLYRPGELYRGFADGGLGATFDRVVFGRARRAGQPPIPPREALAQRLHDHGITVALDRFRRTRHLVGVMGGHAVRRDQPGFVQAVALGRSLARAGWCVVTGGGPGAMEAANLGAATSDLGEDEVDRLVDRLAADPDPDGDPEGFVAAALDVLDAIDRPVTNLSVPTWFYGHEPTNPFATAIAKYFSNSEREDGLLAIATGGVVFLAGGPGTFQEIFQDAAQNAYRTFGRPAPMVFLDPPHRPGHWERSGVVPALDTVFTDDEGGRRPGADRLAFVASPSEAVAAIGRRPGERTGTGPQSSSGRSEP